MNINISKDEYTSKTNPLTAVREKWLGENQRSPLFEAYGTSTYAYVWDMIRRFVCRICGVLYVRQIPPYLAEIASDTAKKLCAIMYENGMKVKQARKEFKP